MHLMKRGGRAEAMGSLAQSRRFTLSSRALSSIRSLFTADRADEDEVAATIRTVKRETGNCIDPHTAVAVAVAEKESRDPAVPMIVLSTAHAAKFPDAVEAACGVRPALPDWLAHINERPERITASAWNSSIIASSSTRWSRAARSASGTRARTASRSMPRICWRRPRPTSNSTMGR